MPVFRTEAVQWVESAAVVDDGESDAVVLKLSFDPDARGLSVANGIGNELAQDAQHRLRRVVVKARPRHSESDRQLGAGKDRRDRLLDGMFEVRVLERCRPEIPEALAEFRSAGLEDVVCDGEMAL